MTKLLFPAKFFGEKVLAVGLAGILAVAFVVVYCGVAVNAGVDKYL